MFKKRRLLIILLSVFALLAAVSTILVVTGFGGWFVQTRVWERIISGEKAVALVELVDNQSEGRLVKISFDIPESQKLSFVNFASLWGINGGWPKEVSFKLDQASTENLAKMLPLKLNLEINGKELSFYSGSLTNLVSGSAKEEVNFATGGGKLDLSYVKSGSDMELSVIEPYPLLLEASRSGKLFLAEEVVGAERLLKEVRLVYIKVSGGAVYGKVNLK